MIAENSNGRRRSDPVTWSTRVASPPCRTKLDKRIAERRIYQDFNKHTAIIVIHRKTPQYIVATYYVRHKGDHWNETSPLA